MIFNLMKEWSIREMLAHLHRRDQDSEEVWCSHIYIYFSIRINIFSQLEYSYLQMMAAGRKKIEIHLSNPLLRLPQQLRLL